MKFEIGCIYKNHYRSTICLCLYFGPILPKHNHIYAHATFCTAGSMVIRKEGKEVIVDKYTQPINLVHGEWHEIEALEDKTVFINVFSDKNNA
jgi:quercetin dioxygenase-like cupin family protein